MHIKLQEYSDYKKRRGPWDFYTIYFLLQIPTTQRIKKNLAAGLPIPIRRILNQYLSDDNGRKMTEFEQIAQFISWCIEEYSFEKKVSTKKTANFFNEKGVLNFLEKHWEVLHSQGKDYILGSIEDFIKSGETK